jgi:hypothetical protein
MGVAEENEAGEPDRLQMPKYTNFLNGLTDIVTSSLPDAAYSCYAGYVEYVVFPVFFLCTV